MSDDEKTGSFVVKDRRRFDSDGNERTPDKGESKASPVTKPQQTTPPPPKPEAHGQAQAALHSEGDGESEMTFSSFIMSLATQALMQLGEIKPPPGVQIDVDKAAAMQTIDILTMLEGKTRGNLDSEEAHLMEGILHNLRLSFVRASK